MLIFVQAVAAIVGIGIAAIFLQASNPPWPVYAGIGFGCDWGATWLFARWRYGRGVTVSPSPPAQQGPPSSHTSRDRMY
jgi:hypothetical protein